MASKVPLASVASALCEALQGTSAPGTTAPLSSLWSSAAPPAPAPRATVLCFLRRLG
jgi:hypothetical protein